MRRALNVAYALIVDRDLGDDRFVLYDRQLVGLPATDGAIDVGDEADEADELPVEPAPPGRWDPETWGTTPEAQEQIVRALEILGA